MEEPRIPFFGTRMQCYDLVKDSLTVFEQKCTAQLNGQTSQSSISLGNDPETTKNHAYELAFASDDEMFHSVLYDWLIERNLADDLLEVCSLSDCNTYNLIHFTDASAFP